MLPLFLDLTDRLVVVIGGGPVGQRKARAVRAAGGKVRLICLEPRPTEWTDPDIDWKTEAYRSDHLAGAALVFAAGPPELNALVVRDAQARGIWVNAASEPTQGDFILPATVRRGKLVLAISTGGAAPLLTQTIRTHLETQFDAAFGIWVSLLAQLRPLLREHIASTEQRRFTLMRLCQWEWLERIRREDVDQVRAAMQKEIETQAGPTED